MVNSKSFRKKPIKVTHIEKNNTLPEFNFRLNIFLYKKHTPKSGAKIHFLSLNAKVFYELNLFLMIKWFLD
jgi:hypothetical protein